VRGTERDIHALRDKVAREAHCLVDGFRPVVNSGQQVAVRVDQGASLVTPPPRGA
jgi:hypothetical protein